MSFQIINFNQETINEEFKYEEVWEIIFKFSTLITFKTMMKLGQIQT